MFHSQPSCPALRTILSPPALPLRRALLVRPASSWRGTTSSPKNRRLASSGSTRAGLASRRVGRVLSTRPCEGAGVGLRRARPPQSHMAAHCALHALAEHDGLAAPRTSRISCDMKSTRAASRLRYAGAGAVWRCWGACAVRACSRFPCLCCAACVCVCVCCFCERASDIRSSSGKHPAARVCCLCERASDIRSSSGKHPAAAIDPMAYAALSWPR